MLGPAISGSVIYCCALAVRTFDVHRWAQLLGIEPFFLPTSSTSMAICICTVCCKGQVLIHGVPQPGQTVSTATRTRHEDRDANKRKSANQEQSQQQEVASSTEQTSISVNNPQSI